MAKKITINAAYVQKFVEDNNGYPEKGYFEEKKDLQKFYKHLSESQLLEWIGIEGLGYIPSDSEPINRMRQCMAILELHFPKEPTAKKKSKYSQYSLDDLLKMAIDKDVVFEMTDDERILRMRAIMALRVAKVID